MGAHVEREGPMFQVKDSWVHVDFVGAIEESTLPSGPAVRVALRDGSFRIDTRRDASVDEYLYAFKRCYRVAHPDAEWSDTR